MDQKGKKKRHRKYGKHKINESKITEAGEMSMLPTQPPSHCENNAQRIVFNCDSKLCGQL